MMDESKKQQGVRIKKILTVLCMLATIPSFAETESSINFSIDCAVTYLGATYSSSQNVQYFTLGKESFSDGNGYRESNSFVTRLGPAIQVPTATYAQGLLIENTGSLLIQIGQAPVMSDFMDFKFTNIIASKQVQVSPGLNTSIATGLGTIQCKGRGN